MCAAIEEIAAYVKNMVYAAGKLAGARQRRGISQCVLQKQIAGGPINRSMF